VATLEQRIHFRSKYAQAWETLVEFSKLLPKGYQVYVLFDSWFASGDTYQILSTATVACDLRLEKQPADRQEAHRPI